MKSLTITTEHVEHIFTEKGMFFVSSGLSVCGREGGATLPGRQMKSLTITTELEEYSPSPLY